MMIKDGGVLALPIPCTETIPLMSSKGRKSHTINHETFLDSHHMVRPFSKGVPISRGRGTNMDCRSEGVAAVQVGKQRAAGKTVEH